MLNEEESVIRIRSILLSLLLVFSAAAPAAHAAPTPTEARAIAAAENDRTAYTLPPEKLAKAEALYRFDTAMHFGGEAFSIAVLLLLLRTRTAARMGAAANRLTRNRWAQAAIFFLLFRLTTTLLHLPISIFAHHVSLQYGLSVQGWASWSGDMAKNFAIIWGLGTAGVMLFSRCMRWWPRNWWLPLWFGVAASVVAGTFVMPYSYDPLFNHFEPLAQSNPALVHRLEQVVARAPGIAIPPERMFLMRASAKSTGLNAYVTGFGASKRVVVWDTSIAKADTDQVLQIFGHEMGHYVLHHIVIGMAFGLAGMLLAFFLGFHVFQWLLARYGPRWGIRDQHDWAAVVVILVVYSGLQFFAEPISNTISRSFEHAADVYGQEVVHGIVPDPQASGQQEFQVLGETSFDDPNPSPLVEFLTGSHPPIWFRAAFAKHYDPWGPGEAPKYFQK